MKSPLIPTVLFPAGIILFLALHLSCENPPGADQALQSVWEEYQTYQDLKDSLQKTDWPFYTDSVVEEEIDLYQGLQVRLENISISRLSESNRINYELLGHLLKDRVFNLEYQSYLMPLNSEGGFVTGILYRLQNAARETSEDRQRYLQKLQRLPAYMDRQIQLLEEGLASGKTVPKLIVSKCLDIVRSFADTPPPSSIFLAPVKRDTLIYQQVLQLVESDILPAYQRLVRFLEESYLPRARESMGLSELPEGHAYYEERVHFFTTLDISPEEVFEIGQKEVSRIKAEMDSLIGALNFQGSFDDFISFLRTDPQFYAKSAEELLNKAAWQAKRAESFLPQYFGKLPRMPFTVEPVPASIAPNYTGGRYSEGSYETHKAGAFWVNTYRLQTRPLYVLPSLTLHEAVPGHHLQIMLSKEQEDVPKFRRDFYLSAFGEGWALYAEYLGKEAGMYKTPYEDFGRLTYEMWRACRLVVDVGIHAKNWSRQEAVDFLASHTALALHEVNTEIDRYIGDPGQALSYKMGEITIRQLRKQAETSLGDSFDIRVFHDLVLSNGSVPMQSLKRVVQQFIDAQQIEQ